jgi:hypothetical protein
LLCTWAWTKVSGDAIADRIQERFGAFASLLTAATEESSALIEAWFRRAFTRERGEVRGQTFRMADGAGLC